MSELIPTHAETSSAWSEARRAWRANRFWMETQNHVSKQYGGHRKQHWHAMRWLMRGVELRRRPKIMEPGTMETRWKRWTG